MIDKPKKKKTERCVKSYYRFRCFQNDSNTFFNKFGYLVKLFLTVGVREYRNLGTNLDNKFRYYHKDK